MEEIQPAPAQPSGHSSTTTLHRTRPSPAAPPGSDQPSPGSSNGIPLILAVCLEVTTLPTALPVMSAGLDATAMQAF
ncbi:hypothetical protein PG997_006168 [Apiospora hydei]|uniref:Uncharacterized protein n=1 Tax=Apiospora hydei TaxID=1337664 RepID=A0ABR1WN41_9PEZI